MENTNKEEILTDELICPITLELLRDLVRAKDALKKKEDDGTPKKGSAEK